MTPNSTQKRKICENKNGLNFNSETDKCDELNYYRPAEDDHHQQSRVKVRKMIGFWEGKGEVNIIS